MLPGRSATARPTDDEELRATLVLRLPIAEGAAKVRAGGVNDDDEDLDLDVWAGVVPLALTAAAPIQDPDQVARLGERPAPAITRPV